MAEEWLIGYCSHLVNEFDDGEDVGVWWRNGRLNTILTL